MSELRLKVTADGTALDQLRQKVSAAGSSFKELSAAISNSGDKDLKQLAKQAETSLKGVSQASNSLRRSVQQDTTDISKAFSSLNPTLEKLGSGLDRVATAMERMAERGTAATRRQTTALKEQQQAVETSSRIAVAASETRQRALTKEQQLASAVSASMTPQDKGGRQRLESRGEPLTLNRTQAAGARSMLSEADFNLTVGEGSVRQVQAWLQKIRTAEIAITREVDEAGREAAVLAATGKYGQFLTTNVGGLGGLRDQLNGRLGSLQGAADDAAARKKSETAITQLRAQEDRDFKALAKQRLATWRQEQADEEAETRKAVAAISALQGQEDRDFRELAKQRLVAWKQEQADEVAETRKASEAIRALQAQEDKDFREQAKGRLATWRQELDQEQSLANAARQREEAIASTHVNHMNRSVRRAGMEPDAENLAGQYAQAQGILAQQAERARQEALGTSITQQMRDTAAQAGFKPNRYNLQGVYDAAASGLRPAGDEAGKATRALKEFEGQTQAVTRGVAAGFDNMWLSYGKYAVYTAGAFAAVSGVKQAMGNGIDFANRSQRISALDDEHASKESIQAGLMDASKQVGQIQSAREMAGTLEALTQAGIKSSQGMQLLATTARYAAVEQVDAKKAGEDLIGTMYNFGLVSETNASLTEHNFKRTADVVAYVATRTSASMGNVNDSFKNVIGVSKSFNVDLETTAALVEKLGKSGIKGGQAGTITRNFLEDVLGSGSKQGSFLRGQLGLKAYDAGKDDPVAYIDKLVEKLRGLNEVKRVAVIDHLTDERGRKELNELVGSTESLSDAVARLREHATDGLPRFFKDVTDGNPKTSIDELKGAWDNLLTHLGSHNEGVSALADSLTRLVTSLDGKDSGFSKSLSNMATGLGTLIDKYREFHEMQRDAGDPDKRLQFGATPKDVTDGHPENLLPRLVAQIARDISGKGLENTARQIWERRHPKPAGPGLLAGPAAYDGAYGDNPLQLGNDAMWVKTPFAKLGDNPNTQPADARPKSGTGSVDTDPAAARKAEADAERAARIRLEGELKRIKADQRSDLKLIGFDETDTNERQAGGLLTQTDRDEQLATLEQRRLDAAQASFTKLVQALGNFRKDPRNQKALGTQSMQETLKQAEESGLTEYQNAVDEATARREQRERSDAIKLEVLKNTGKKDLAQLQATAAASLKKDQETFDNRFMGSEDREALTARQSARSPFDTKKADLLGERSKYAEGSNQYAEYDRQIQSLNNLADASERAADAQARLHHEQSLTAESGLKAFSTELRDRIQDNASLVKDSLNVGLNQTTSLLTTFATTGKASMRSFFSSVTQGLAQVAAQRASSALFNLVLSALPAAWGLGTTTPAAGAPSTVPAAGHHLGGMAGTEPTFTRSVPMSLFSGAPRYHTGTLAAGEIPAILKQGEGVFTPEQMKNLAPVGAGNQPAASPVVHQEFNVTISNAQSAQDAQEQAAAASRELRKQMKSAALEVLQDQQRSRGALRG